MGAPAWWRWAAAVSATVLIGFAVYHLTAIGLRAAADPTWMAQFAATALFTVALCAWIWHDVRLADRVDRLEQELAWLTAREDIPCASTATPRHSPR